MQQFTLCSLNLSRKQQILTDKNFWRTIEFGSSDYYGGEQWKQWKGESLGKYCKNI